MRAAAGEAALLLLIDFFILRRHGRIASIVKRVDQLVDGTRRRTSRNVLYIIVQR